MSLSNSSATESTDSSRSLTQQLDDIANEASFYTPLEEPNLATAPKAAGDTTDSHGSKNQTYIYNDNQDIESSYFVPHMIRKLLPGSRCDSSSSGESQPLLPISKQDCHISSEDPGNGNEPSQPPPPPPPAATLLTSVLEFNWNNIFTEAIRQFLTNHRSWVLLIGLTFLIAVGLILYLTGNLAILVMYVRILLCYVFGGSSPAYCKN